jgi:hypothetical protein
MERATDKFVRHENVKHFEDLLTRVTDPAERERIEKLLKEERQKQIDAGDLTDEAKLSRRLSWRPQSRAHTADHADYERLAPVANGFPGF